MESYFRKIDFVPGATVRFRLILRQIFVKIVRPVCGEAVTKSFYLNVGDSAEYTVQAVVPSCDCVVVSVGSASDAGAFKVDLTYTADSVPGAFSRYADVFFNEKDTPERLVVYGFIKMPHAEIANDAKK